MVDQIVTNHMNNTSQLVVVLPLNEKAPETFVDYVFEQSWRLLGWSLNDYGFSTEGLVGWVYEPVQ